MAKLLKIIADNYKNCADGFCIDLMANIEGIAEDKLCGLQEIADGLYRFNLYVFIGKNASGKTTALELINYCYRILTDFRLSTLNFDCDNTRLTMYFYHNDSIYKYSVVLRNEDGNGEEITFADEELLYKLYQKSRYSDIFSENGFKPFNIKGTLPKDTSSVFFALGNNVQSAAYISSDIIGENAYKELFKAVRRYHISNKLLLKLIRLFDTSIEEFSIIDESYCQIKLGDKVMVLDCSELQYRLSSGTLRGALLEVYVYASLKYGFDLLVDDIELHLSELLVKNMLMSYTYKEHNKNNAFLMFTTHCSELLNSLTFRESVWRLYKHNAIEIECCRGAIQKRH